MRVRFVVGFLGVLSLACASADVDKAVDESTGGESAAACVDADSDGYCAWEDCNDADSEVFPCASDARGDDMDMNCDGIDGVVVSCETGSSIDDCCVHCGSDSKPCGDSCISRDYECHQGDGCACY